MGVIARALEAEGLATTSISLIREHTARVKPPRALWVPFPYGHPLGAPGDPDLQLGVIRQALALLDAASGPLLADYAGPDPYGSQDIDLPQAAAFAPPAATANPADELTSLRASYEASVAERAGRTTVGLSGVPQRRFRGIVRFLEDYADGKEADHEGRPADMTVPRFIRVCVDDLKAFYLEARVHDRPREPFVDSYAWLWGETALGVLVRRVRDRMKAAADPALDAIAFGIAR